MFGTLVGYSIGYSESSVLSNVNRNLFLIFVLTKGAFTNDIRRGVSPKSDIIDL